MALDQVRSMSETAHDPYGILSILESIFEALEPSWAGLQKVDRWIDLSRRLSHIASKEPPWSWRYMQGVATGSIAPSPKLVHAITTFAGSLDDYPVDLGFAQPVLVLAAPGTIKERALVLGASRPCENANCRVWFVPRVPWQKYHSADCRRNS